VADAADTRMTLSWVSIHSESKNNDNGLKYTI